MKGFRKIFNMEKDNNFTFIRKGKVGSFREEMPAEWIEIFDNWIHERIEKYQADPELLEIFTPTTRV